MIMTNKETVFKLWLAVNDGSVYETIADNYHVMVFKVKKSADFDYIYVQRLYNCKNIERGGKFEYSGIYNKRDNLLYDSDDLWGLVEPHDRNKNGLKQALKQSVCDMVEAAINNDRGNLTITELTDERELRDLEYAQKYDAANKARAAYLSGEYDENGYDFKFKCQYSPAEWTEDSLLDYIRDPHKYAAAETKAYIKNNQESMLANFLKADLIAAEYAKILDNPQNPVHCVKRIISAVKDSSAKTVTVTIRKGDIDFTFKAEAKEFHRDCVNSYSTYNIAAADRREFERIFGRNANYTPDEIVKIEHARKVLYQAEEGK